MKKIYILCMLLLDIVAASACHAETINITTNGVTTGLSLRYNSTVADFFSFNSFSPPGNLVATVNDVTDLGMFSSAELGVVTSAFNRTFQRTITTIIPPTNFP